MTQSAFLKFAISSMKICINVDQPNTFNLINLVKRPYITFGFSDNALIQAKNVLYNESHSSFDLFVKGIYANRFNLELPGKHNIMNALAAISVCVELDINYDSIKKGLSKFKGVQRRFDINTNNGIKIVHSVFEKFIEKLKI